MKVFDIDLATAMTKLMARENISVEFGNYSTAFCDPKSRRILFPTKFVGLSRDIMSIFSAHEVSHALYSPEDFSEEFKKYGAHVMMVLEDCRIENKIKADFVGLAPIFEKGYKTLAYEHDFFGFKKYNIQFDGLSLIDRVNLKSKIGVNIDIPFTSEELQFYNRAMSTETWEDVIELAIEYNENWSSKEPKDRQDSEPSELEKIMDDLTGNQEENEFDDPPMNGSDMDSSDDADESADNSSDQLGNQSESAKSESESESSETDNEDPVGSQGAGSDLAEGITDRASEEWQSGGNDPLDNYNDVIGSGITELLSYNKVKEFTVPFSTVSEARQRTIETMKEHYEGIMNSPRFRNKKKMIQLNAKIMANEFESKKSAFQNARVKESRRGELDMRKLSQFKFTDDLFLMSEQKPNTKDHGLIMFVDFSGSMHSYINETLTQMLVIVEFCRLTNIPHEIYAFSNAHNGDTTSVYNWLHRAPSENYDDGVENSARYHIQLFSSTMTKSEYNTSFNETLLRITSGSRGNPWFYRRVELSGFDYLNGTPLNEARADSIALTDHFLNTNKVQKLITIFLTDGNGSQLYMNKKVRWKNKIFYADNFSCNTYRRDAIGTDEFLYKIYKEIYPQSKVFNFYLNPRDYGYNSFNDSTKNKFCDQFKKNGSFLVDGKDLQGYYDLNNGFDHIFIIDPNVLSYKASRSRVTDVSKDSWRDTDTKLGVLEDSFMEVTQSKKKTNLIARQFVNIVA